MVHLRLKELMDYKQVTTYKLAKLSRLSQPGLASIIAGDSSPTVATLQKICDALGVELASLFSASVYAAEEQELVLLYRSANDLAKDIAVYSLSIGSNSEEKRVEGLKRSKRVSAIVSVPVVGRAAAGLPIEMIEERDESITVDGVRSGDFAVVASGDSMIGAGINDGDRIVIRPQEMVENGEIALVAIEDGSTIKRVHISKEGFKLTPENPQYEPQFYSFSDAVRILGKVVKVIK